MITDSQERSCAPDFDRVARLYRWAEYLCLGPLLQRTREGLLHEASHARHVLALGDGDGRFVAALLRKAPTAQAVAVDASAKMLALLRDRCAFAATRLNTLQVNFVALSSDIDLRNFDLVVSHFSLDCLSAADLRQLTASMADGLGSNARWLISDFAIPSREPLRIFARVYIRSLYWFFRLLTDLRPQQLPDISGTLEHFGFKRLNRRTFLCGLLFTELWLSPQTLEGKPEGLERATSRTGASSTKCEHRT